MDKEKEQILNILDAIPNPKWIWIIEKSTLDYSKSEILGFTVDESFAKYYVRKLYNLNFPNPTDKKTCKFRYYSVEEIEDAMINIEDELKKEEK